MLKIALISCSKLKENYPCKACQMYRKSTLFSYAVRYISNCDYDDWMILSAKYGLVEKDKVIEPYDETLNRMKSQERKNWANNVAQKLLDLNIKEIDFYTGSKYREYLIPILEENGVIYKVPLKGLGIGQQLKFYNDNLKGD